MIRFSLLLIILFTSTIGNAESGSVSPYSEVLGDINEIPALEISHVRAVKVEGNNAILSDGQVLPYHLVYRGGDRHKKAMGAALF